MRVAVETCETCGRQKGEQHVATEPRPSLDQLMAWTDEGGAEATDGCWVEPDGYCEHGHASWLIVLGMI